VPPSHQILVAPLFHTVV